MANIYKNAGFNLSNTNLTTIYTVPTNRTAIVKSIQINNDDASAIQTEIFFTDSSASQTYKIYHKDLTSGYVLNLDTSDAQNSLSGAFNSTAPSSSVVTLGNINFTNNDGSDFILYAFAPKTGYSKFGKYSGNSNADGAFIYLGFKPSFIMVKRIDTGNSYDNWIMYDNKRSGYNVDNDRLHADIPDVENTDNTIDMVSNGFKIRSANSNLNGGTPVSYTHLTLPTKA